MADGGLARLRAAGGLIMCHHETAKAITSVFQFDPLGKRGILWAIKTIMTEQGLLIPKEEIEPWGEVVVEEKPYQLTIRPKSLTQLTYGSLKGDPKWWEKSSRTSRREGP